MSDRHSIPAARGWFAVGITGQPKSGNLGNLIRTAHGFGAAFVFVAGRGTDRHARDVDTSRTDRAMPVFEVEQVAALPMPRGAQLVGVEITDEAVMLPEFCHPTAAVYVLGDERGGLAPEVMASVDHVIRIPTRFSLNLATAGAIVMYDRLRCLGRFADRAVTPNHRPVRHAGHVFGEPIRRKAAE